MATPDEIATWRFEQIEPLVNPKTTNAEKKAHLAKLKRTLVAWPLAERDRQAGREPTTKAISPATANRWRARYAQHGLAGLRPSGRDSQRRSKPQREAICDRAIGLLYERPARSLTLLLAYLRLAFPGVKIVRATLHRDLVAHPAYAGILAQRRGGRRRRRDLYEVSRFHQIWQIDAKGPFPVLIAGFTVRVRVISVIEAKSRKGLAETISIEEDLAGVVRVLRRAIAKYGLPESVQMDRLSTYEAWALRGGLAELGVHRRFMKARNPEANGLVEAYHRSLGRWFVDELPHQVVRSLEHLEVLLVACIDLIYNTHYHRSLKASPAEALGERLSERRIGDEELARAFWVEAKRKAHVKTGIVELPGDVLVQVPERFVGITVVIRYAPDDPRRAELVDGGRRLPLAPYSKKAPSPVRIDAEAHGSGELQKLADSWRGVKRPNAEPGFGLPEVFTAFASLLGHSVPANVREAEEIQRFYRAHGPLPAGPFRRAVAEVEAALGRGHPLAVYLDYLARLVRRSDPPQETSQ
jgi:transposase InsO family protein